MIVAYDYLQVRGGAERVTLALRDAFEGARVLVAGVDRSVFGDSPQGVEVLDSRTLPRNPVTRAMRAWWCFSRMREHSTETAVLLGGHFAPLSWRAFPRARRVLYLHGPPLPFVFDEADPSIRAIPGLARLAARLPLSALAREYRIAVDHIDTVLANSAFVAHAFERRFGRTPVVVPPPVDAQFFRSASALRSGWVSIARHEPMKRVDRVVEAFVGLPHLDLVVAGEGSQTEALRAMAGGAENIRFTGILDTPALAALLGSARASIHVARAEPFGLAVAESLAAGAPVLACAEGGVTELIRAGHNGWLVEPDPSVQALRAAIHAADRDIATTSGAMAKESVAHLATDAFMSAIAATLRGTP
jgi:glycosyltransferase involved in cell wall biosynthesis